MTHNPTYHISEPCGDSPHLVMQWGVNPAQIENIQKERFSTVALAQGDWGDLSFLVGRRVTGMSIFGENIDWESINRLDSLSWLDVKCVDSKGLDISRLPRLKGLGIECGQRVSFPGRSSSLSVLDLKNFSGNLSDCLDGLDSIRMLRLVNAKDLTAVRDLPKLANLEFLELAHCRNLQELNGIGRLSALATLRIDTCNKVLDICPASGVRGLRELSIFVKNIATISCLKTNPCLEIFMFQGKLQDGNTEVLLEFPALRFSDFRNARGYNLSREQIRQRLIGRGFDQDALRDSVSRFPSIMKLS